MDSLPDIFNTPLIPEDVNQLWEEANAITEGMEPADTLVISTLLGQDGGDNAQLLKMLQACRLTKDLYNLIELPADGLLPWHRLKEQLKPRNVVLVGIEPRQLGMSVVFMPHQVTRFDGVSWVFTWSIPQLEKYPEAKKHLWLYGLKPVFVPE